MDSFLRPDPATLMLTAALVTPLLAAGHAFLWWQTRDRALLWWAGAALAVSLGTLALLLSDTSLDFPLFGNACLLLSQWLVFRGVRALGGAQVKKISAFDRIFLGALLAVVLVSLALGHSLLGPPQAAILIAALAGACSYVLFVEHSGRACESAYFVGGILVLSALFNGVIGVIAWGGSATAINWTWVHAANFVFLVGWNFGFLMLIGQRNQERVTDLAEHDELTGASTRRALLEKGRHLFALAARKGPKLSVLMLDLDLFKQINDAYGHAAGDRILKDFSAVVDQCLRGADVFGRLGGEEFCVLLPDTDIDGALRLGERIRREFSTRQVEFGGKVIRATVSIGVASYRPEFESLDALLARADEALYQAKHHGRDCVVAAGENDATTPMVRLVWDGRYRSGNAEIDREHEYLFSWANALLGKMQSGADIGVIEADVRELLHWASAHFRHEEKILATLGWEGLERHAVQHRALEARGAQLLAEVQAGQRNFAELLDFVVLDIISGHMARHDTQYFSVTKAA